MPVPDPVLSEGALADLSAAAYAQATISRLEVDVRAAVGAIRETPVVHIVRHADSVAFVLGQALLPDDVAAVTATLGRGHYEAQHRYRVSGRFAGDRVGPAWVFGRADLQGGGPIGRSLWAGAAVGLLLTFFIGAAYRWHAARYVTA